MSIEVITILLFASLLILLALKVPVAMALGGITVVFTYFLWGPQGLANIPLVVFRQVSPTLLALPLFLLMASVLERSGIADALYEAIYRWTSFLAGGLAMGTVMISTIFAAMSGVSGAATVSMGLIAIPSMLKRNYSKFLATGSVAAGGVLGIVIPPSVIMIIYASITKQSVGQMFFGGIVPGLVIAAMHIGYIYIACRRNPSLGPPIPVEERVDMKERIASLKYLILPAILIFTVLGSIYTGIATPSEAAGIGAFGAFICAAVNKRFNWDLINHTIRSTLAITCMVMWIVAAASAFNATYIALGGRDLVVGLVDDLEVNKWLIILAMHIFLFIAGMIMDDYAVVMLAAPIFAPIAVALGFHPIWFGVSFILNKQMAYLTPPYGFNLFYLKGIVPKEISMGDIYRSIVPFVIIQALGLLLIMFFPQLVTWLPDMMRMR